MFTKSQQKIIKQELLSSFPEEQEYESDKMKPNILFVSSPIQSDDEHPSNTSQEEYESDKMKPNILFVSSPIQSYYEHPSNTSYDEPLSNTSEFTSNCYKIQKPEGDIGGDYTYDKNQKSPVKIDKKISKPIKKGVYMLPGESKNIPKNFTRALKHHITSNFHTSIQLNPEIKKFLSTKPEKACKQTLENSLKNCHLLQQIAQNFFGNLQWGNIFLDENKVELEPYFRFNKVWFGAKN